MNLRQVNVSAEKSMSKGMSSDILSENAKKEIDQWLTKFPPEGRQSGVLYALHVVQAENGGWLTEELLDVVADYLNMPKIAVYEVATFYSMFELEPVGKNKICICTNIPCMLSGSEELVKHFTHRLNIGLNETTIDGQFTLKEVECLGACGCAPVLQVNGEYIENVTKEKIDTIIKDLTHDGK